MIYLIGEILVYLLAALLLGGGAGWLLRGARPTQSRSAGADLPPLPAGNKATSVQADPRTLMLETELMEVRARASELESQAAARAQQIETLTRRLTGAERQVQELERERALQNRALQVLHQQLELAVERRSPVRATGTDGW